MTETNNFTTLKSTPAVQATGLTVRYRLMSGPDGYAVHLEQRFDNGVYHSGFLARGVSIERANGVWDRHTEFFYGKLSV
jgi:hypothetical protein